MGAVLTTLSGISRSGFAIFSKIYVLVLILTFFILWLVIGTPFSLELPANASDSGKGTYTVAMALLFNLLLPFFLFGLVLLILLFFAGLISNSGTR